MTVANGLGQPPRRYRDRGADHGCHGEVAELVLRCACGTVQTETLDANAPLRAALAETSCLFCGAVGQMRVWKADT